MLWGKKEGKMRELTAKLIVVYNGLYKNAMNLDSKTNNKILLGMQGKNRLLNIIEQ